jgi:outer membrane protein
MTGKLCRSMVAGVLASVIAMGPVMPGYGQNPAPPSGAPPAQNPTAQSAQATPGGPYQISVGLDYTRPRPPWRNVLLPYTPAQVPEPQFANTPRIDQLIHDGKMELSVQDAIGLAVENNLDIMVNRYYSWMAETDILRAKGGGNQRGVNIVGVPIAFANVPTLSYDPLVSSTLSIDSRELPVNNPLTSGTGTSAAGAPPLFTHTGIVNFGYAQAFHEGTQLGLTLNNTRTATSSTAVRFNPSVQSTGTLSLIQPLLNGFGYQVNQRYINMALITKQAVDSAFLQTLITDITAVEDDYWELVFARGNVDVQARAVDLAQRLYDDNKKQVEIGTLAPIEIVRAEAQLATAQQDLINAQTIRLQQQTLLMSVITKNPASADLRNVEIVPTDTTSNPPPIENIPLADAVSEALAKRPDVQEAKYVINGDDVNVKATRNALLPNLALSAFVTGVGLGGNQKTTTSTQVQGAQIVNGTGVPQGLFEPNVTQTTVTGINQGGFGDAASQLFRAQFPELEAQLALSLPIRNRVAQADNARAQLTQRQDQARLQQLANTVEVDVQNAQITFQQDRAALVAAQKTRELQQETLDAEEKKLQLGASTIFLVVTDQQALSAAAAAEVRAAVNLAEARVNFERALGRTLEANRITVANAKSGVLPKDTLIPGTTQTGELIGQK